MNFNKFEYCPKCSKEFGTYHYVTIGLPCSLCNNYLYSFKRSEWNNLEDEVKSRQYEKTRPLFNTIKKANLVLSI